MKKVLSFLCVILAAAMLSTAAFSALTVSLPQEEVYAVLELVDGDELIVRDAPGEALMDAADAYELYVEDTAVLSVDHLLTGAGGAAQAPQFYSVNFIIPGTQNEVFLTGLRAENVEEIQQRLIDNYVSGQNFDLTDLAFIDTEKTRNEDNDDDMCWAASASDMLTYTGWTAQAGFGDEDDVFEAFIDAFENGGGHQFYAISWFFNGALLHDNSGNYGARALDYPNSGGYLKDYAFDRFVTMDSFTSGAPDRVAALLREGCAVGIGAYLYYDGVYDNSGHAMTVWGFITDNSLPADDPARYLSIFITDSDSDELADADRRDAPDVMSVYALDVYEGYYWFDFDAHYSAMITDYFALAPYSADTARETDPDATKDKVNRPDLAIGECYVTDNGQTLEQKTLFESGTAVSVAYQVSNFSDHAYNGYLYTSVTLTRDDGTAIYDHYARTFNVQSGISTRGVVTIPFLSTGNLEEGDYTLTCSVNTDHGAVNAAAEGYYCNNTKSVWFRVRDSYLLGDFDGNGEITILDATKIQRYLAGFSVDPDEKALQRGDVNGTGLNILGATVIQRYLASFTTTCPVGEKQLYL